jgi:hypothetical protein
MSNTNITTTTETTTVVVEENIVRIELNNIGVQGIPGANTDPTYVTVRNATGATLAKGTIVYISGANGNNVQVTPAIATSDATSARTLGWLAVSIPNNGSGLCMVEGYLEGLNTQGFTAGAQLYLSGTTAGAFTETKPQAPTHLVYVGVVTKVSSGDGHVFVKVQNGYELGELHDVLIVSPTNNQVLAYDSATQLWKNATNAPDGVTSITATAPLTGGTITSTGSIGLDQTALSITKSQVSDFSSGTVTSASTAQQAGTAVYAVNSGTAVFATTSGTSTTISGTITKSQVTDFTSGTVASAGTAQQSGTAVYSVNSGTAVYATTSGTAVTISGDITKSQVSDFTSGTVAQAGTATYAVNSGTATFATTSGTAVFATNAGTAVSVSGSAITQSQVVNLTTDLAGKANLAGGNALTGAQTITSTAIGQVPLTLVGASGQTANLLSTAGGARIPAAGNYFIAPGITSTFVADFNAGNTTTTPVTIAGVSGQTANLLRLAVAGTDQFTVGASGILTANGGYLSQVFAGAGISGGTLGRLNVSPFSSGQVGAVLRGAAGQSVDLLQMQDSAGNIYMSATAFGGLTSNLNGAYPARWSVGAGSPSVIGLIVRGAASQTANLQVWQDSSANTLASVNGAGLISSVRQISVSQSNSGETMMFVRGAASQTGDSFAVRDNSANTIAGFSATGRIYSGVSGAGQTFLGGLTLGSGSVASQLGVVAGAATTVGAVIRGAASQSANLQEWQSSAGSIVARVDSVGDITARVSRSTFAARFVTTDPSIAIQVNTGAASQTGDFFQTQTSTGTVMQRLTSAGLIRAADNVIANALVGASGSADTTVTTSLVRIQANSTLGGGWLQATRLTSAPGSITADSGQVYFRTGTNPNTLKLVVKAGAGAEQTIIDNIPTT